MVTSSWAGTRRRTYPEDCNGTKGEVGCGFQSKIAKDDKGTYARNLKDNDACVACGVKAKQAVCEKQTYQTAIWNCKPKPTTTTITILP